MDNNRYENEKRYECKICSKIANKPITLKCAYCKKKLCKKCHYRGYCKIHYDKISHDYKKKLKMIVRKRTFSNGVKIFGIILFFVSAIYLFGISFDFAYILNEIVLRSKIGFSMREFFFALSVLGLSILILYLGFKLTIYDAVNNHSF